MDMVYVLPIHKLETSMGKTTVVIDDHLLKDAIAAIGARSKKEAIEAGLRALVRQRYREALRKELGTFDLDLTLGELERLRHAD
jgi:Arc/MetJ family transcription regulator